MIVVLVILSVKRSYHNASLNVEKLTLIRGKVKKGEGELVPYDPRINHACWKKKMAKEEVCTDLEKYFHKAFYQMADRVEQLFADYQERVTKKEKKKKIKEEDEASVNQEDGEEPPEPPSPSSISISYSSLSSHHSNFH